MSNVFSASRRVAIGAIGLSMVMTGLVVGSPTASATGPDGPTTALPFSSVPFTDHGSGDEVPYPQSTGAANSAVAAECNSGQPIFSARWYAFTPANAQSVVALGSLRYAPDRMDAYVRDGIAILDADLAVIDCNRRDARRQATAGATTVAAGAKVYVVHFALDDFCDPDDCIYGVPDRSVQVLTTPPAPTGDDWPDATPITRLDTLYRQDQTLATNGDGDPGCEIYYEQTTPSTWWTFTPTVSGPLDLGSDTFYPGARLAELTSDGPKWVENADEPWLAGCDSSQGLPVEAGHTYLLTRAGASVKIMGPALGRPDLTVTAVTASPAKPKTGRPVAFRATVKNTGSAPTAGGVPLVVSFEIDGTRRLQSSSFVGALAPGASVTLTGDRGTAGARTWPATTGKHTLRAYVDRGDQIDELTESNNARSTRITVRKAAHRPDLVVTSVTARPAHPAAGTPTRFIATVKNIGRKATRAGRVHSVRFTVDGVASTWSRTRKAAIRPGGAVKLIASGGPTGRSTWSAKAGSHAIGATVDDRSTIAESNEANNTSFAPLVIGAALSRPDLQVIGVSWSPTSARAGAPVRFSAVIKNTGTRSTMAGAAVRVAFKAKGSKPRYAVTTTPLSPGATARLTADATWSPPKGASDIVVTVDDTHVVSEDNEADNALTTTFTRS